MDTLLLIINILSIAAAGAILTDKVQPLQQLKEYLGFGIIRRIYHKNKILDYFFYLIHHLFNCPCISFWLCWYICGFWPAFLCYFISTEIYKQMNRVF